MARRRRRALHVVSRTDRFGLPCHSVLAWDLIPDEGAPEAAIIMCFPTAGTAREVLAATGFIQANAHARLPRNYDSCNALVFVHPDGAKIVLARRRLCVV